jgi:hypothetical protein
MVIHQLDYVVEKVKKNTPTFEQQTLKYYTGANFRKEEAEYVWKRVIDHKWYVGERLQRDIGLRVAAVDYVENFYDASMFRRNNNRKGLFNRIMRPVSQLTRDSFEAKSKTLSSL